MFPCCEADIFLLSDASLPDEANFPRRLHDHGPFFVPLIWVDTILSAVLAPNGLLK